MTSQVSPVTFPVNWTKVVYFARNSVFGKQMAEKTFLIKCCFNILLLYILKKEVSCVHI